MSSEELHGLGSNLRAFLEGFLQPGEVPSGPGAPFPPAGINGFLSHFVFTLRVERGDGEGQVVNLNLPSALQSVVRSSPFVYRGRDQNHAVEFPLPEGSALPRRLTEAEFLTVPPNFFEVGKETIFMQILNLDARAETSIGPIRIILGETFRREYPDVFQPSFGGIVSLGASGFPAKLFFSPNAVFETRFGAIRTRPKALVAGRFLP